MGGEQLNDDDRPLSAAERKALRDLLESDRRVTWFWGTVRVWATWIAAVALGFTVAFDLLKKSLNFLVK